jgi:hypothetical protein
MIETGAMGTTPGLKLEYSVFTHHSNVLNFYTSIAEVALLADGRGVPLTLLLEECRFE